jgi:hypothetical protein
MMENPYQSPTPDEGVIGVNSGSREDLRKVAQYQRGILFCILFYLIVVACQFALTGPGSQIILGVVAIILSITGTVFVFMLAMKVYSTVLGIFLGILTLIPCVGLICLLIVNGKATTVLRANGISVGLLGADPSKI